jgi:hypothetical protein
MSLWWRFVCAACGAIAVPGRTSRCVFVLHRALEEEEEEGARRKAEEEARRRQVRSTVSTRAPDAPAAFFCVELGPLAVTAVSLVAASSSCHNSLYRTVDDAPSVVVLRSHQNPRFCIYALFALLLGAADYCCGCGRGLV